MNLVVPTSLCIAAGAFATAAQVWFWRRTSLRGGPRAVALGLRLGAIGLLAWILTGPRRPILESTDEHPAVILTDVSRSMDFPAEDVSRAAMARRITQHLVDSAPPGGGVIPLAFGARLLAAGETPAGGDPVRDRSLPATALRELLAAADDHALPHSVLLISDVTFLWGTLHNTAWGPAETAVDDPDSNPTAFNAADSPRFNNSYYRRFWQRSIRWLAENSLRVKGAQFDASTPHLARPDILAALADSSGGKVLRSAGEAAAWLAARSAAISAPERTGLRPAWDRPWALASVLLLLSADGLVRRIFS